MDSEKVVRVNGSVISIGQIIVMGLPEQISQWSNNGILEMRFRGGAISSDTGTKV